MPQGLVLFNFVLQKIIDSHSQVCLPIVDVFYAKKRNKHIVFYLMPLSSENKKGKANEYSLTNASNLKSDTMTL